MKYFIIWIEGLNYKSGEKVATLNNTGYTITTRMTKALRVREGDLNKVIEILKQQGVSDWTLENCAIETYYAPKGTIFN